MASKQIGLGTIVKVDHDSNASFTTMTLVESVTHPPREREVVEGVALEDTLNVPLLGIEATSEMTFTQFWEPGDTTHEYLDTLFGSKAAVPWQIVTPHGTPKTDEFNGRVKRLGPTTLSASSQYMREVVVLRTGSITRT